MSLVLGKRPDLLTAYLHVSSKWDGGYEAVVRQRLQVYFAFDKEIMGWLFSQIYNAE